MNKIKTAIDILKSKETYDSDYPTISLYDAEEAMKEFAVQFIDLAISEEFGTTDQDGDYFKVVELKDLEKIKQLIK